MALSVSGNQTNQSGAHAAGDIVGRDKNTVVINNAQLSGLQAWAEKLKQQVEGNETIAHFVDSLEFFEPNHPDDDVVGLEEKLRHSGRNSELRMAIRKKEFFAKLLERWQHYEAAQEIISFYLHLIENRFRVHVYPKIDEIDNETIDALLHKVVVEPVLEQAADVGVFLLNENHVSGMVYWLAEKCYVRWHK